MYQLISKKDNCVPLSWAKRLMVIAVQGGYAEVFWVCDPHIYVTQSVNIHFFLNAGARFFSKDQTKLHSIVVKL